MDKLYEQKPRLKFIFPVLILISISVGWAIYDFTFIKRYISFIYAGSDPHAIGLSWYNPRFVISKDKIVVISIATVELAHYYEVVLQKISDTDEKLALRPTLTPEDIDRILDIAEDMDMQIGPEDDEPEFELLDKGITVH